MSEHKTDRRQCFYLVDETQSARLEQFRYALKGLSQLAHNPNQDLDPDHGLAIVDRAYLASVLDLFDDHLGMILNGYTERTHWTGPKPKPRPAPGPETKQ